MRQAIIGVLAVALLAGTARAANDSADVIVYGGTSGGVIAAVQAGRMGKRVLLVAPEKHLGGMTTGGLGATDMGNQAAIGGVAREFYGRILKYYQDAGPWREEARDAYAKRERYIFNDAQFGFEPHVAEKLLDEMLAEAKVRVVTGQRLDRAHGVAKDGARIVSIRMESGDVYAGKMFVDGTYEGDLLAAAGVSYMLGREANSLYGETLNGVQTASAKAHQFGPNIDPYVKPGDKTSGLLPNIHDGSPGVDGNGDRRMQAYNYRLCLTDAADNRVPFPKPQGYDERDFELLIRATEAGLTNAWNPRGMPNRKTDTNNNGPFSTDYIGMADGYPEADYATREQIIAAHVKYTQGFLWTLANHPRVPEKVRAAVSKWGLAKDEFTDNGNWPYQLYVREARRMVGEYVMTEADCKLTHKVDDPIGLGSYNMDSHNTQRYVDATGHARNEGDVQVRVGGPYGISYRSIVPKATECTNLLVPVCMSATHIAYGSIRMEPVYMIMGQACGTAASIAIDDGVDVQKAPYAKLRERLLADRQLVEWKGGAAGPVGNNVSSKSLAGIVVDESKAKLTGEWAKGSGPGIDEGYLHDQNEGKGRKSARYEIAVPADGEYEVRLAYTPNPNRATNVPVTVESADGGRKTVRVNQKLAPPVEKHFVSVGVYTFAAGRPAVVTVSNEGTDGYVIIDAVQVVGVKR